MGNEITKPDNNHSEFEIPEEPISSDSSVLSDLSFFLDDGSSITTDSTATTTTEYESANEYEIPIQMTVTTQLSQDNTDTNLFCKKKSLTINKVSFDSELSYSELENSTTMKGPNVAEKVKNIASRENQPLVDFVGEGEEYFKTSMNVLIPTFARMQTNVLQIKSNFHREVPHVYEDFLIPNYDLMFVRRMEYSNLENTDFLTYNLYRTSEILEAPTTKSEFGEFPDLTDCLGRNFISKMCLFILYDIRIQRFLNFHSEYTPFFNFHLKNAFAFYNGKMYKLRESVGKHLFSPRFVNYLGQAVFVLKACSAELCYALEIAALNVEKFADLFDLINIKYAPISNHLRANISEKILPSVSSEILNCAFQFSPVESNVMNCKENVSEAGPTTAADIENINNAFFSSPSDLDFISKLGGTGVVAENLRKESLYVKFDPLVSQEVNSSLNNINNDETIKLNDFDNDAESNVSEAAKTEPETKENKPQSNDLNDSSSNEIGSIAKLVSVTPTKSPRKMTPKSSPRYLDSDPDDVAKLQSLLLKQMKKEEVFKEELESIRQEKEETLKKLQSAEQEISNLKSILEAVQENEKKLKNELKERLKSKHELSLILEEYEKTVSQLVNKREEEKKEYELNIKKIEAERDSSLQHLHNLENAFNDIHQKYERGKTVNEALKKNEDALKKSLSDYENTVKTVENKYELLKSHATSQLEKANQELELITQSYEKEQAKLKAMLRKSEIQSSSLQNALDRKTKENQELTSICDELIVKLSTHSSA